MFGLGTIINCSAIIIAGIAGMVFGNLLKESMQDTLMKADGVAVIFIGIAGALSKMLVIKGWHYRYNRYYDDDYFIVSWCDCRRNAGFRWQDDSLW